MLFLLSKAPKAMHQSIVPILFSLLESHASGAKFMRLDRKWKEMCGMMGNLVAESGAGKGQFSGLPYLSHVAGKHAEITFPVG